MLRDLLLVLFFVVVAFVALTLAIRVFGMDPEPLGDDCPLLYHFRASHQEYPFEDPMPWSPLTENVHAK